MKILNTVISAIRIPMINHIYFCVTLSIVSHSNNMVNPHTAKIHITICFIRLAKSPDIIIFSYSLTRTRMTINRAIIPHRIMLVSEITFSDFFIIFQ